MEMTMMSLAWLCGLLFLATILTTGFAQAVDLASLEAAPALIRSR